MVFDGRRRNRVRPVSPGRWTACAFVCGNADPARQPGDGHPGDPVIGQGRDRQQGRAADAGLAGADGRREQSSGPDLGVAQGARSEHRRRKPSCDRAGPRLPPCRLRRRAAQSGASRQAVDRRAAVPEHERRPDAGLLCRRHRRGHHHGAVPHPLAVRDRTQLELCLQGPSRRCEAGGSRARRALCARRRGAEGRGNGFASPRS